MVRDSARALGPPLRALIVSYTFPPVGGVGVQRVAKLVKYLPDCGVTPLVLTAENPSVPLRDPALCRDISPDIAVYRARTLEPGYAFKQAAWAAQRVEGAPLRRRLLQPVFKVAKSLLLPDPQILWQPNAHLALARLLVREAPDVVLITGPPFSQFLLSVLARCRPGTAVVLDYRDEWSTYRTVYEMMSPLADHVGAILEPLLLRTAHAVTTATEAFRRELLAQFRFLDPAAVQSIPNGYDPDDFPETLGSPPSDRFVLTFAGTVLRMNSPRGLLGAVRLLHERAPALARRLEVRFVGRVVETEQPLFAGMEAFGVRQLGYVERSRALQLLAESHVLLCVLDDVPGADRMYPAKIFEMMYLGRPCLFLAPEGALTWLVRRHRLGEVLPPRDEQAIAGALERRILQFIQGKAPNTERASGIERFDRRVIAAEFARTLRYAVDGARGATSTRADEGVPPGAILAGPKAASGS